MKPLNTFVFSALVAIVVAAPLVANATTSINLIYDGLAMPNTRAAPTNVTAFNDWCATGTACIPTVQQPMYDMATGKLKGTIYVWATVPFNGGTIIPSAFCFSEFFVVALAEGDLYAHSGPNGTCGATMDPVMKPPKFTDHGAQVVIAGGGDGVIVGGTRKFQAWTGTFTDRVFVGFGAPTSGVGGIVYYDSLMFSFTGK
ncbi:MAG: hypothetical protein ABIO63_12395 [Casimicrobiaceae bacterium]